MLPAVSFGLRFDEPKEASIQEREHLLASDLLRLEEFVFDNLGLEVTLRAGE